jgi:hypothetical protein
MFNITFVEVAGGKFVAPAFIGTISVEETPYNFPVIITLLSGERLVYDLCSTEEEAHKEASAIVEAIGRIACIK